MKFELNKSDINKLNSLFNKHFLNLTSSDFYNSILDENFDILSDERINKNNIFKTLLKKLNIDIDEVNDLIQNNKINEVKELDVKNFKNNPYLINVKVKENISKNIKLSNNYYEKNELFLYDETYLKDCSEITCLGYFKERFEYPILADKNNVWMNVTPYEINTMSKHVEKAHGKVLALGLGLGYFPYMVSLKDNVKSVDIVEIDDSVINNFKNQILPSFSNGAKIKIIQSDAYEYLKNEKDKYDYIFVDIYRNSFDGLISYLKCPKDDSNIGFWIENEILLLLRRYLITLIYEQYNEINEESYKVTKDSDFTEVLMNKLYEMFSDNVFNSYKDIEKLLSYDGLKEVANNIKI